MSHSHLDKKNEKCREPCTSMFEKMGIGSQKIHLIVYTQHTRPLSVLENVYPSISFYLLLFTL